MTDATQRNRGNFIGTVGGILGLVAVLIALSTSLIERETAISQQSFEDVQDRLAVVEASSKNVEVRIEDVAGNVEVAVDQIEEVEETSTRLDDRLDEVEESSEELRESLQELADGGAQPLDQTTNTLVGTWDGFYRCQQGVSGATLTIEAVSESKLRAYFEFFPTPENPTIPSGSLVFEGTVSRQAIDFSLDYWVERPAGYRSAGFSAALPTGDPPTLEGTGKSATCERYEFFKTSDEGKEIPL